MQESHFFNWSTSSDKSKGQLASRSAKCLWPCGNSATWSLMSATPRGLTTTPDCSLANPSPSALSSTVAVYRGDCPRVGALGGNAVGAHDLVRDFAEGASSA